jgi:hypothetical protein
MSGWEGYRSTTQLARSAESEQQLEEPPIRRSRSRCTSWIEWHAGPVGKGAAPGNRRAVAPVWRAPGRHRGGLVGDQYAVRPVEGLRVERKRVVDGLDLVWVDAQLGAEPAGTRPGRTATDPGHRAAG